MCKIHCAYYSLYKIKIFTEPFILSGKFSIIKNQIKLLLMRPLYEQAYSLFCVAIATKLQIQ